MRHAVVLDGRNCYALEDMKAAGIIYESIGRQYGGGGHKRGED